MQTAMSAGPTNVSATTMMPVRIGWSQAARLPGKSLHLATVLQSLARAQNTKQVVLSNLVCQEFGTDRNAKYRALGWLEEAGLIAVERKLGRSPLVTILDRGDAA